MTSALGTASSGRKQIRYTVDVSGRQLKILSISLEATGLVLALKSAEFLRVDVTKTSTLGRIREDQIHFHHSFDSPDGNLITRRLASEAGPINLQQFTYAVKKTNAFAHVISRRFPDISFNWPASDDGPNDVDLGEFDPQKSNLIISCFVGPRERPFSIEKSYTKQNICISENVIGEYKIILLYCFYGSPSILYGTTVFYNTSKFETSDQFEKARIMNGFSDYAVLEEFCRMETYFRADYYALAGGGMMGARVANGLGTATGTEDARR